MMQIAIRIQDSGEVFVMERGRSGAFEFGDPAYGQSKHHACNAVLRPTVEDAVAAIGAGLHPRMRGQTTGQWNMIAPAQIKIIEVPV